MKKIGILLVLLFLTLILIGQSAQLNYNKVEVINGGDTILLDNEGLITFTKGTLIMQNTDKRINTFLVPGSEFDKLDVAVFDDTQKMMTRFSRFSVRWERRGGHLREHGVGEGLHGEEKQRHNHGRAEL